MADGEKGGEMGRAGKRRHERRDGRTEEAGGGGRREGASAALAETPRRPAALAENPSALSH